MNLELTADEAAVLYSAAIAFAEVLGEMRGRTAAMSELAETLKKKESMCYDLSERIAKISD